MSEKSKKKHVIPKRINGKHIKHSPNTLPLLKIEHETTFLVKSSTPYISAMKRIQKILAKFDKSVLPNKKYQNVDYKKVKYVTVKGMGKAIENTLSIALKFQDELNYKVDILTGSVEVLDEFQLASNDGDSDNDYNDDKIYKKRMVSYIEARIWLKRE
ncbi:uncharacterized protein AC631_02255 [Debaryomyces fabryi]|uniref:Uncharacterized protein n=1 Tax=Debaryomyces fabryi TaxID=58627 RepID=A0A0V1Q0N7_9ASCO|nr:uncharacterized protein AC631_02255 [Debaryomyces fabryi]KSA01964.1 hypothetical protein AC631_02255 [Debaryomyces fabryi]CUM54548.1 unnamed protein product [Debaryomyces fabryi]